MKKTMTKNEELLSKISEAIRPFVYPYVGSDFMTGHETEEAKDFSCKNAIDAIRPLLSEEPDHRALLEEALKLLEDVMWFTIWEARNESTIAKAKAFIAANTQFIKANKG